MLYKREVLITMCAGICSYQRLPYVVFITLSLMMGETSIMLFTRGIEYTKIGRKTSNAVSAAVVPIAQLFIC